MARALFTANDIAVATHMMTASYAIADAAVNPTTGELIDDVTDVDTDPATLGVQIRWAAVATNPTGTTDPIYVLRGCPEQP